MSKKQQIVLKFNLKMGNRTAMANTSSKVAWVVELLEEFGVEDFYLSLCVVTITPQYCIVTLQRTLFSRDHTKPMEIYCRFIGKKVMQGLIVISYL